MALTTLLELQMFATASYEAVITGTMPAKGMLTPDEETLMLDWLSKGAKGVPQAVCR
jgi:hypothetical protein